MNRADQCEATFPEAQRAARLDGMKLTNPSDGCYQLRCRPGWIYNLYPRRNGMSPRVYSDPHHRGPFLDLPRFWNFLDVVKAAAQAQSKTVELTQ